MRVVDAYIRRYNRHRIKLSLGSMRPVEYRRHLVISAQSVLEVVCTSDCYTRGLLG